MGTWVVSGPVIAAIAVGVIARIAHGAPEPLPAGLIQAVRIALSFLVAPSLLTLVLAAVFRAIYWIQRAERDAQGCRKSSRSSKPVSPTRRDDS